MKGLSQHSSTEFPPSHSRSSRKRQTISPSSPSALDSSSGSGSSSRAKPREVGPTLRLPAQPSSRLATSSHEGRDAVSSSPVSVDKQSSVDLKRLFARPRSRYRILARRQWQSRGLESLMVIVVNGLLITAAIGSLVRLFPLQVSQYRSLQLLEEQVEAKGTRTARLQAMLDRRMDPLQEEALIKEEFNQVPWNQLHVRLVDPQPSISPTQEEIVALNHETEESQDPQPTPSPPQKAGPGWILSWSGLAYMFNSPKP